MKALSLWQPWASLVALGRKRIETRSWPTSYRGPLAIHAAKRFTGGQRELAEMEPFCSALGAGPDLGDSFWIPVGCIVAVVELEDCVEIGAAFDFASLSAEEEAFGDYSWGRFAWLLGEPRMIDPPIECKGRQGLFDVTGFDATHLISAMDAARPLTPEAEVEGKLAGLKGGK